MKACREFEIAFVGLKPGIHVYNYRVDDSFFERIGKTEFHQADVEVKMSLDKKTNIFLLHFDINGTVVLPCDRCGEDYKHSIWDEFDLVVKIIPDEEVARKAEIDADVAYIGRSESILDVSDWIYEFVVLSVPIQHIHPDLEDGKSGCNPEITKYLSQAEEPVNPFLKEQLERIKTNSKNKN